MDNEIQILKSLSLMEKVVERLDMNARYYRQGNWKETELYKDSPFLLDSFKLAEGNIYGANFLLELNDYNTFLLKLNEEDPGIRHRFGIPFKNDKGTFIIALSPINPIVKGMHRMTISPISGTANSYRSQLRIERIGDQMTSSVLSLSITDPVPEKTSDILNTLIEIYNEEEIKDENQVLSNTITFIDGRVTDLVKELDAVEGRIQQYKSNNEIISNDASSSMDYTLSEIRASIQRMSDYEVQKQILTSLENFMTRNSGENDLIPASLSAENPVLGGLVSAYNDLVARNKQLSVTATEKNPSRIALEKQIRDNRDLILETIRNLKKDIDIPTDEIEKNIEDLKKSMGSIPKIEKQLIEKKRIQAVKEQLFLYLLQKKEETALSEAVATAKTRIIDRARKPAFAIYPKRKLIQGTSIVLGLLVPFVLVIIASFFETKIDSEEMIKDLTNIPILGRIAYKKGADNVIVKYGSRSAINEMFRLLRTNLNFINHNKEKQIILMTSSISGEGKTFVAINLGITLALSNKKVILLGMDLRKPKMSSYLNVNGNKGITNYLVGQSNVDEIIQAYKDQPNLSYISSGPIPPNPAELILSKKMKDLLKELSERYDYVLIDTPPIGLVSDALLLRDFVDNILIIVRHKYTRKVMLRHLENMKNNNELPKASIIFNGVKRGRKAYGYGGYYAGKNSYYIEDE